MKKLKPTSLTNYSTHFPSCYCYASIPFILASNVNEPVPHLGVCPRTIELDGDVRSS
jgi:hypothetical protein